MGAMNVGGIAAVLVIAGLGVAGCGGSETDAKQAAQRAVSWAATARMVGEAWRAGEVPDRYAARTLQAVRQSLRESIRHAPSDITPSMQHLADAVGAMEQAVKRRDQAALVDPLRAVEDAKAPLARAAKEGGR
jgi:hypothetical protein